MSFLANIPNEYIFIKDGNFEKLEEDKASKKS